MEKKKYVHYKKYVQNFNNESILNYLGNNIIIKENYEHEAIELMDSITNNMNEVVDALEYARKPRDRPLFIVAKTSLLSESSFIIKSIYSLTSFLVILCSILTYKNIIEIHNEIDMYY